LTPSAETEEQIVMQHPAGASDLFIGLGDT
jgi:hypothetical protein